MIRPAYDLVKRGCIRRVERALCYDDLTMKSLWPLLFIFIVAPGMALESLPSSMTQTEPEPLVQTEPASRHALTAEMWARPRSGQAVLSMSPVRTAIRDLLNTPESHLLIRYPGGDEGSIWAEELQGWLISLGIEPTLIEMRPGSSPQHIELEIMSITSVK